MNIEIEKTKVEELRQKRNSLLLEAEELKIEIIQKETAILEHESGLKKGDKVMFKDGKEIKSGILEVLHPYLGRTKVRLFKKDGTLGSRLASVWHKETLTAIK